MAQQESKVDSILAVTKEIKKDVKSQVESRLGDRKFGFEVAPAYLLASQDGFLGLRGTVSYFALRPST